MRQPLEELCHGMGGRATVRRVHTPCCDLFLSMAKIEIQMCQRMKGGFCAALLRFTAGRNGRLDVDMMAMGCGDQGGRQLLLYLRGSALFNYTCPFLTHVILSRAILSRQRDQR